MFFPIARNPGFRPTKLPASCGRNASRKFPRRWSLSCRRRLFAGLDGRAGSNSWSKTAAISAWRRCRSMPTTSTPKANQEPHPRNENLSAAEYPAQCLPRQHPQLYVDMNRAQCISMGVSLADAFNTLQIYLGSRYVNDFNLFGRTWQVNVQADAELPQPGRGCAATQSAEQRGHDGPHRRGCRRPRGWNGPLIITRYNMYPAAALQGQANPGVSSRQAIDLCSNWPTANCHTECTTNGPSWPTWSSRPATRHVHFRAGGVRGVPGPGRPVRELVHAPGRDPGGADVPAQRGRGRDRRAGGPPLDRRPARPGLRLAGHLIPTASAPPTPRWTSTSSRRSASWSWWGWPARTRS